MPNYYNWRDTLTIGEKGVKKVIDALKDKSPVPLGHMLRIDRQRKREALCDIEIVIQNSVTLDWPSIKLEVKSDRRAHETGNFFLETVSQAESNRLGGFLYTSADFFFYLLLETNRLFIFKTTTLQKWIKENRHAYSLKPVCTPTGNTHYTTLGLEVPIPHLSSLSLTISEFYDVIRN